jgi:hypothetical protein
MLLGSDPLRLSNRHLPGAASAVAPHPYSRCSPRRARPAVVAPVPLRVGGGVSNALIVLEVVWDSGVTVDSLLPPMMLGMRGKPSRCRVSVETGQARLARVAGRVIEHGHSSSLHDAVRGQVYGL